MEKNVSCVTTLGKGVLYSLEKAKIAFFTSKLYISYYMILLHNENINFSVKII